MKYMTTHNRRAQKTAGFTLVELMVALSLFTIVVLAAVSTLYTVNRASRNVQAMRTVLDNLNFAIESMSRTIRTGTDLGANGNIGVDSPFGTGVQEIILRSTFEDPNGNPKTVRYACSSCNGDSSDGVGSIQKWVQGGSGWIDITSQEIDIQQLMFFVEGSCPPSSVTYGGGSCDLTGVEYKQPSVSILIIGVATAGGDTAPFAVQTYVSQRAFE
jgi:prepilin-type N-terminal cleavage/methylation domain-containing protein